MSRSAHGEWDLSEGKRESFHDVAQVSKSKTVTQNHDVVECFILKKNTE